MIVRMRSCAQAAKVAEATGGVQLAGKPKPDGTPTFSRYVEIGVDFEAHRPVVESVSVLFELYDGDANSYAATGGPGAQLPSGWMVTAAKFEVEWPADPQRAGLVRSHFGARRKAFNWGLAQVKADLDAKAADPAHESVDWDLKSLRWAWNRAKDDVAPWWAENSKECYSSGLADLAQGLANWKAGKNGTRKGRRVGFPRFKSGRRDPGRVRFTTGTMRIEDDRRTITVPVIGPLRAKENTRRVQRHLVSGRAQILNMTLSQRWGRLFVAVCYALRTPTTRSPLTQPTVRAGMDLGVRTLATVATLDTATGEQTIIEYPNPAPLKATLVARRRAGRELSRRIPGSHGHRAVKAKLARLDRRCVAPTAGSSPPAHHRVGGHLWPGRDRRPRRGRDETQHAPAGVSPIGLRCRNGFGRAAAGLQNGQVQRRADGGGPLVCLQPNPPRLHQPRRHTVPAARQGPHRQTPALPCNGRGSRPRQKRCFESP
ncbi:transposase [Mycobacterium tuberculosis TKK_02_0071]|nr:transposase [Mycobacterium tuberculosis TKK_02_0047]KCD04814.1 transposase [Mycobacterium tuberculosis TKK_02_0071]